MRLPDWHRYIGALQGHYASSLSRRQFFTIVGLFWAYVTLSNVLWAYGMRTGIAKVTNLPLFSPWDARVLQHMYLLPLILVSYWASMRIQWRPLLVAVPLQIILALSFAALAYPALILGEYSVADHAWHMQVAEHGNNPFSDPMVMSLWLASFVSFLPTYGFGLTLVTGLALYSQFRKSEVSRAALEREWSAARLAALRMQLSPHTLFNLLHTILIEWDPKGAQSMVVQLADLLRRLLNAGERDFSRLAEELQFVRLYLELQQKRFSDRLSVILPKPEDMVDAWVPSLIMQPLVENAVVHGLAGHQGPVTVRLTVGRVGDSLVLRVTNTIAAGKIVGPPGIGVSNVRERLAVQFEGRASLIAGPVEREWVSEITLPEIHASPERRTARPASALMPA
jgi:hypothetical protein